MENGYHSWLRSPHNKPMQLDRYYPDLMLAIEVQGKQHYKYNPKVHRSKEAFKYLQKCDQLKQQICATRGVKLIQIRYDDELTIENLARKLYKEGIRTASIIAQVEKGQAGPG